MHREAQQHTRRRCDTRAGGQAGSSRQQFSFRSFGRLGVMTTVSAESRDSARDAAVKVVSARSMVIDGAEVVLTEELRHILHELFQHTADGEDVEIVARTEYLSTEQAAEILRISRPTLVRMLDDGLIPYERRRSHRRISRQALEHYLEAEKVQRARALEDFADTFDPAIAEQPVATR